MIPSLTLYVTRAQSRGWEGGRDSVKKGGGNQCLDFLETFRAVVDFHQAVTRYPWGYKKIMCFLKGRAIYSKTYLSSLKTYLKAILVRHHWRLIRKLYS